MTNNRQIFEMFSNLDFDIRLELLRWLDDMSNHDLTFKECVFYEFKEEDLDNYFDGYTLTQIINIIRHSKVSRNYGYFYKNAKDDFIVGCTADLIDEKINKNQDLISELIKMHIKQINNDFGIDFNILTRLKPGDYISFEDDDDYTFVQIVKIGMKYILMNVDTFEIEIGYFNNVAEFRSLNELNKFVIKENATIYHVDHKDNILIEDSESVHDLEKVYKFLVYDKDCGEDFEVSISYNHVTNLYHIMQAKSLEHFYEELFESFSDAVMKLVKDYRLVKRIRE